MKSPSSNRKIDHEGTKSTKGKRRTLWRAARPTSCSSCLRGSNAPEEMRWVDPESAIERKTGAIVPLWVAAKVSPHVQPCGGFFQWQSAISFSPFSFGTSLNLIENAPVVSRM